MVNKKGANNSPICNSFKSLQELMEDYFIFSLHNRSLRLHEFL